MAQNRNSRGTLGAKITWGTVGAKTVGAHLGHKIGKNYLQHSCGKLYTLLPPFGHSWIKKKLLGAHSVTDESIVQSDEVVTLQSLHGPFHGHGVCVSLRETTYLYMC